MRSAEDRQAKLAPARGRVTPVKLAHFVLRTARLPELLRWYQTVLGATIVHSDDTSPSSASTTSTIASLSRGAGLPIVRSSRQGLPRGVHVRRPGRPAPPLPPSEGRGHRAVLVHQPRPDDVDVLQGSRWQSSRVPGGQHAECRGDQRWIRSGAFAANPIGVIFHPRELVARYRGGESMAKITAPPPLPEGKWAVRHAAVLACSAPPSTRPLHRRRDRRSVSALSRRSATSVRRSGSRAHDAWAIGRFDDVRAALRADDVLVSGRGVAMNDMRERASGRASRSRATATCTASSAPC